MRSRLAAVLSLAPILLVLGCSQPAVRGEPRPGDYGTVIGSISIKLEGRKRSGWDGFFEENLEARDPTFVFHFTPPDKAWNTPPERIRAQPDVVKPFVISMKPGKASLDELEISIYRQPGAWLLKALSATDGKKLPLGLDFEVLPGQITYIGRIHVRVPKKLQLFSSKARFAVTDESEADYETMDTLIELSKLPVTTQLAQKVDAE